MAWVDGLTDYHINKHGLNWNLEDGDLWSFYFEDVIIGGCISNIKTNVCTITDFVLNKSFRNKGFGTIILSLLESEFKNDNCKVTRIYPLEISKDFWKKAGYTLVSHSLETLEIWHKPLINCNIKAGKNENAISIWDHHNKKTKKPFEKNISIEKPFILAASRDYFIEINRNEEILYQGVLKRCDLVTLDYEFVLNKN